jgi:hypothetical protein
MNIAIYLSSDVGVFKSLLRDIDIRVFTEEKTIRYSVDSFLFAVVNAPYYRRLQLFAFI